jgi:uncharacterized membrane protein YciS (DUF1049 family)
MIKVKYLVYALVCFAGIYVLASPMVLEAIVDFCFGGVVPGSDRVLSPDTMIIGAMAGCACVAVLIAAFWLKRIIAVKRAMRQLGLTTPAVHVSGTHIADQPADQPTATPAVQLSQPSTTNEHLAVNNKMSWFRTVSNKFARQSTWAVEYAWTQRLRRVFDTGSDTFLRIIHRLTFTARTLTAMGARLATSGVGLLPRMGRATAMWTIATYSWIRVRGGRQATQTWLWLRPRAARFDTWLELRYRRVTAWLKKHANRSEPLQIIAAMYRESLQTVRQLLRYK